MVASLTQNPTPPIPQSALAGRGGLVQFTVDDLMRMIRDGSVAEDASAELLNGYIVHTDRSAHGGDPTMHSPAHRKAVRRLTSLVAGIDTADRHVQIQSPIVCSTLQMPEPDFAVIRGSDDAYTDRLPGAADAFCVVEVADSSLERDRHEKFADLCQSRHTAVRDIKHSQPNRRSLRRPRYEGRHVCHPPSGANRRFNQSARRRCRVIFRPVGRSSGLARRRFFRSTAVPAVFFRTHSRDGCAAELHR